MSLSRSWVNVVMATSTAIIIYLTYKDAITAELLLAYMGTALGAEAWKRTTRITSDREITRERIRARVDNPDA